MPTRACKYVPNRDCPKKEYPCSDIDCLSCLIYKSNQDLKDDKVAHPSHYIEGRKYEPKDVIRDWGLNYNLGCVVKYVSRAGCKDDILQDLRKARQYLDFEIDAIEEERKTNGNL